MKDLVDQLKEHWANTPEEQLRAEWAEIEAMDIKSPNALDYIHSVMNYQIPETTDLRAFITNFSASCGETLPKITIPAQFFDGELDMLT
jgi:hypothetical protein